MNKKKFWRWGLFLPFGLSCTAQPQTMQIHSLEDIDKYEDEIVHVEGTYTSCALAKWPQEGIPAGRYCIQVNNDLQVLLLPPYREESVRPETEVEEYAGKRVRATGVIRAKTYMEMPTLEREPLAVSIPCFSEIHRIELIPN
jgi:hypothetical protein